MSDFPHQRRAVPLRIRMTGEGAGPTPARAVWTPPRRRFRQKPKPPARKSASDPPQADAHSKAASGGSL